MTGRAPGAESSEMQKRTNDFKVLPVLLKGWCSAVFRRAIALGLMDADPTYSLRGVIKRGTSTVVHASCQLLVATARF
jgi:hypothetical protein